MYGGQDDDVLRGQNGAGYPNGNGGIDRIHGGHGRDTCTNANGGNASSC